MMRVGVIDGNSRNDRFKELAEEKGFTYSLVYYEDMDQMASDLQNGKNIDAIVTSNLRSLNNEWVLDKFAASPFYAMVRKGNTELLNQINYAIEQMDSSDIGWKDELFDKYYSGTGSDSIALSSTERNYLAQLWDSKTKVKVLVHPDRAPYSYVEDGVAKGIIVDIFEETARRLELPYEYVLCDTREEYVNLRSSGAADILLEARNNLSQAEDMGYKLTDSYMDLSYASVQKENTAGEVQKVAMLNSAYTTDRNLEKYIKGKEVLYYSSLQECINAVRNNQADASYMYDYSGQKYVNEDIKGGLQSTTIPNLKESLCFAVGQKDDYRLLAILNKGVNSVKQDYVDIAVKNHTNFSIGKLSLFQTLRRNPAILVFMMTMLAALIILVIYIYQRRQKEKMEVAKNIELEQSIEEVRKANAAAKDALEVAKQASESKGNFLSNMSHEIRTPLNAIIGYLTIAKDVESDQSKISHCIDNCDVASRHLLQIINDILDMSSIKSGKLKIAHEDFDLKKEITDITTIFYQNAKAKNVEFETQVDGVTQEWLVGDQLRLNQILMNLLSNAVKFTPEQGRIQLKIQQMNEDDKRVYIQFSVSDTGIGMSQEYMSRIFHPFEQENAGTAKKFGGSGLGLSITNNLIKMMGGTISVDSKQNEGTTFTVTLFFDKSQNNHVHSVRHADYSHVRVLVVDDKADECTYVKAMLKRCGVKSDSVTSGQAALRQIKARMGRDYSYDLCIIDWNMPEMNGCEVTKRIREELGSDLPIIIATAYDVTAFESEAKASGVNKVIAKPLFQSTLLDLLVSTFGEYDPAASSDQAKEKIDMSGVRILLAEDNAMNMEIAVTMLEKTGICVDQARDGKEALDIFSASEPGTYDMILMDVQMPVMDGYEATKQIRKSTHPEAKTIPIIAMTANAFAEDVAEALSNGMNAHIAKPINYDKMFELLKKYAK